MINSTMIIIFRYEQIIHKTINNYLGFRVEDRISSILTFLFVSASTITLLTARIRPRRIRLLFYAIE